MPVDKVTKVITADGDFFLIDGVHNDLNLWQELEIHLRRIKLDIIQEITDLAELPGYLTDEDLAVVEAAKLKLNELTGE